MSFVPKVSDFYLNETTISTQELRKKAFSRVKRVGNLWVTPDGQQFEKQHKAYKAFNEMSKHQEYFYFDPKLKITDFYDLDLPVYKSSDYFVVQQAAIIPQKQTIKFD
ncbi:hypothetical protein SS50377_25357 [Spironucleus salmonicida]|uniref:Uncharacterized protein n=1 Tax=Spironucleus salmonicida TaxID=348837 RepID=V6LDL7_9EUKA|nr:hypothetical protein SS50377_25357 [Spironucleus salmonicida]|eukprot:EST41766.1 Hypothetical protein SS50377_18599 [Spironucleus salmonicida]